MKTKFLINTAISKHDHQYYINSESIILTHYRFWYPDNNPLNFKIRYQKNNKNNVHKIKTEYGLVLPTSITISYLDSPSESSITFQSMTV